jgi:hypothetical protein
MERVGWPEKMMPELEAIVARLAAVRAAASGSVGEGGDGEVLGEKKKRDENHDHDSDDDEGDGDREPVTEAGATHRNAQGAPAAGFEPMDEDTLNDIFGDLQHTDW